MTTTARGCRVSGCKGSAPGTFGLCEAHRAKWLVSPERKRRSWMRQLGYPKSAINSTFVEFVIRQTGEDLVDLRRAVGDMAPSTEELAKRGLS